MFALSSSRKPPAPLRQLESEFVRATEMAALGCLHWIGKGNKNAADAAACDAIRDVFNAMEMRGEIVIGEGIKDDAPGLFAGERVGTWREDSPRLDIAIDPLDGTTNLSKGLPNSMSCIAAAIRSDEAIPALRPIPSYYMKKLAFPSVVQAAWMEDSSLPLDINAPFSEVIKLTAQLLRKDVRDVRVSITDRRRNDYLIEEARRIGASLRLITDGDIGAAIAPAISSLGIDLYAGIGGSPEGVLAAAALQCLGGGMQAQMWPRDEQELADLEVSGHRVHVNKVFRSRDLAHGEDILFVATGIGDSPLLRGLRSKGSKVVTHSVLMQQLTRTIRFVRTAYDLNRPLL